MIKEIKDFENYKITSDGVILLFDGSIKLPSKDKKGYLHVTLSKNGKKKTFLVHRLVAQTFIPNIDNLDQVNHIDGVKTNNNVNNLEWVTCKDNIIKSFILGLSNYKGERCGRCKFSDIIIEKVKTDFKNGKTRKELSRIYNISYSHIVAIINGNKRTC